jgi:hypothetical protein
MRIEERIKVTKPGLPEGNVLDNNAELETQNPEFKIRNQQPASCNTEPGTRNRKPL